MLQDITEQTKATEQLRFMANNDPLTKVFNRRGIEKMFESAIGPVASGKPLALAYLDLDRFKLINDLFGHTAGDEVLKQVCERMADDAGRRPADRPRRRRRIRRRHARHRRFRSLR